MNWERALLLWIHAHRAPALDRIFLFSRWLGNTDVLIVIVLAAAATALFQHRQRLAATWLLAGLATFILGWALKALIARPRPQLWPWLIHPHDASFPSGHALGTSMVFSLLAATLARGSTAARVVAAVLILYVGIGRLYLGVHWPTDVLGGWALGLTISALALRHLRSGGAVGTGSAG